MTDEKVALDTIENFLAHKRIAMVGVSRESKDFSVTLFKELRRRGYEVVPVNPKTSEVLGQPCFARVQEIQPPVEAALLMTSPDVTDEVVHDCAEAGIRRVWMYRAGGVEQSARRLSSSAESMELSLSLDSARSCSGGMQGSAIVFTVLSGESPVTIRNPLTMGKTPGPGQRKWVEVCNRRSTYWQMTL